MGLFDITAGAATLPRSGGRRNGTGTSGGQAATNGGSFPWRVWLAYALMLTAIAAVGASSFWMEASRDNAHVPVWPFAVDEATSAVTIFLLTPLLVIWTRRLDPRRIGWAAAIIGHLAWMTAFGLLHVAGMTVLRLLAYPLFGASYGIADDSWLTILIYEGRKDALTYAGLVAATWLVTGVLAKNAPASVGPAARIEIRDGARRIWLDTVDILWIEAAGNYVELHLADRSLLRRQTLSALTKELGSRDFRRIHRSRLVNARHVSAAESNDSGDFTLTLSNGRRISGGRRWREALDQLSQLRNSGRTTSPQQQSS